MPRSFLSFVLFATFAVQEASANTKSGSCPSLPPGTIGTCVSHCFDDGGCSGTMKCCSHGCGHSCVEPSDGVCTDIATDLPDLRNRSVLVDTFSLGVAPINDEELDDGWYRPISDGVQYLMADNSSLPDSDTCGTWYPIYLKVAHPDTASMINGEERSMTACLRSYDFLCDREYNVKLRKCHDEFHYYLETSLKFAGYCFDPNFLNADFNPMVKPGLYFETKPAGQRLRYIPHLTFECDFTFTLQYNLSVKWFVNNSVIAQLGPTTNRSELILYEQTLISSGVTTLGFDIKCEVSVSQAFTTSLVVGTSDNFFAGIKMLNKSLTVTKSAEFKVYFKLTVPLGCLTFNDGNFEGMCDAELSLVDVGLNADTCNEETAVQSYSHRCDTIIPAVTNVSDWDPDRVYTVTMVTTDRNYADPKLFFLSFIVDENHGSEIWKGYQPDTVNVIVSDSTYRFKVCGENFDPHLRTVDGRRFSYHSKGQYIQYKNVHYGIEVQVQFDVCNSRNTIAMCTCAAVIRAGSDIFEFNFCKNNKYIGFKNCGQGGILRVIQRSTYFYEVHSPIGSFITVRVNLPRLSSSSVTRYPFLNVFVHLAPKDFNNTIGLCGTFDNNLWNDFQLRNKNTALFATDFAKDWRVNSNESLFISNNYDQGDWEDSNQYFCYCNKTGQNQFQSVCSAVLDKDCGFSINNDKTKRFCSQYSRRSVHPRYQQELQRRLNMHVQSSYSSRIQKRNVEVTVTELEAKQTCTDAIMGSAAAQLGAILTTEDFNTAIENCVFDAVEMNDTTFAEDYVTSLNEMIKTELDRDPEFRANNSELITTFYMNSCERNCSSKGTCSETGECSCETFYHGSDCSIDERDALVIDDITGAGFCEITLSDCDCYDIITENLLEGFQCRTEQLVVLTDGTEQSMSTLIYNGSQLSAFEGECCMPSVIETSSVTGFLATKYIFSISNDGTTFSNNRTIIVYDDTCQYVTGCGLTVSTQETSSTITTKEASTTSKVWSTPAPTATTTSIEVSSNTTIEERSTPSTALSDDNKDNGSTTIIIIAAACGGVVAILIIAISVLVVLKMKKKPARSTSPVSTYVNNLNTAFNRKAHEGACGLSYPDAEKSSGVSRSDSKISVHFMKDGLSLQEL